MAKKRLEKLKPEERLAELQKLQKELDDQKRELREKTKQAEKEKRERERKLLTRGKIVTGALVIEAAAKDPALRERVERILKSADRKQDQEAIAVVLEEIKPEDKKQTPSASTESKTPADKASTPKPESRRPEQNNPGPGGSA